MQKPPMSISAILKRTSKSFPLDNIPPEVVKISLDTILFKVYFIIPSFLHCVDAFRAFPQLDLKKEALVAFLWLRKGNPSLLNFF